MRFFIKFLVSTVVLFGFLLSRENSKVSAGKVKGYSYIVKDDFQFSENNQLDRKRTHKRRRKIRKPKKGLR